MSATKSPCCNVTIDMSRGDGITIGSCSNCDTSVCRVNPRTGQQERLDGKSPWYPGDDLRPMLENRETKKTPDEWCQELGCKIMDPDGWRTQTAPSFTQPITLEEFQKRFGQSTVSPPRNQ